jgi:pimeloyl-ACP methyl ester carboxylesterase
MHLSRRHFLTLAASLPMTASAQGTPVPGIAPYETVRVGDIDVGYRVRGEGEPLVLIMGFAGTMDAWDPTFLAELASRYQVITFDNRGIGATSGTGRYRFDQLAGDVAGLIDALEVGPAHVFGWSMGAMIALELAIRHRELVRSVVLHAGDIGGSNAISASPDVLADLLDTAGGEDATRQRELDLMFPPEWVESHPSEVAAFLARPANPVSTDAVLMQGNALLEWYVQDHAAASVRVPTMIMHGAGDVVIPVANAQILADAIPGSWLIRLPGGHGLHYQSPVELAALCEVFLSTG